MAYMPFETEDNVMEQTVSDERVEGIKNALLENKELIDSNEEENYPSDKESYMKVNPEALRTVSDLLPNEYESDELEEIKTVLNQLVEEKGGLEKEAAACLMAVVYLGQQNL